MTNLPRESDARTRDLAVDFVARRDREARRFAARRPKRISDVVAQLIAARGYGRLETDERLASAWSAAAGPALARFSRVGKLRRGTLEVAVANSTIMQEFTFERDRILAELARSMPDANIRGLKFRVGQVQ